MYVCIVVEFKYHAFVLVEFEAIEQTYLFDSFKNEVEVTRVVGE